MNYYSNPDVMFNDNPTGTALADNARIITENRFDQAAKGDESGTCGEQMHIFFRIPNIY